MVCSGLKEEVLRLFGFLWTLVVWGGSNSKDSVFMAATLMSA